MEMAAAETATVAAAAAAINDFGFPKNQLSDTFDQKSYKPAFRETSCLPLWGTLTS